MAERMITYYETVDNFYEELKRLSQTLQRHSVDFDKWQAVMVADTHSDDLPQMKDEFEKSQSVFKDIFEKVDKILERTDKLRSGIKARMAIQQ